MQFCHTDGALTRMKSPTRICCHQTELPKRRGFAKIKGFCDLASASNCRYGWVDTCCINKGNSSELTEAINSMYLWYSCSALCVVYLEDIPQKQFSDSEWFDRGWTLQELIAPKAVSFFDHEWNPMGSKTELLVELSRKTKIPKDVLSHTAALSSCSVAQRMSWAAKRKTKRIEDRAYSLMGLFNVNMPMIYGEREKAFLRLQQHIIQQTKDESIFAWTMEPGDASPRYSSLYAPSPSVYLDSSYVTPTLGSQGFTETNGELSIELRVSLCAPGIDIAVLNCTTTLRAHVAVGLIIARLPNDNTYVRVRDHDDSSMITIEDILKLPRRRINVPIYPCEPPKRTFFGFWLRTLQPPGHTESDVVILSNCQPPGEDYVFQHDYCQGNAGIVCIKPKDISKRSEWSRIRWIKLGFNFKGTPALWLANDSQSGRLQRPFENALASQRSEERSCDHEKSMTEDTAERYGAEKYARWKGTQDRYDHFEWPAGRSYIWINKEQGLTDHAIPELNLQVSIQLVPFHSPTRAIPRNRDRSGFSMEPMTVWAVDITETKQRTRQEHEPLVDQSTRLKAIDCITWSLSLPCILPPFCFVSTCPKGAITDSECLTAWATVWKPFDDGKRATKAKKMKIETEYQSARATYAARAESRIIRLN
ncbi:hypothetical protein BU16DRAFT_585902 [Lophium mytilinum]|uniref:Heterokaryon incompatibility domain-containing protein n=1 Tax=Lophium mytilinum TaxID=390894 RepID=A0A6A6QC00_9PEZI|nr:hypothetical protein BU16DRAFT_585902 [Lophium mytilinum]